MNALVSREVERLATEIFNVDVKIIHLGLINLDGDILLDQSSAASNPSDPDPDRIEFYNQLNLRRNTRENFDDVYGKADYLHIVREKMQQIILYLPMITVYLTLDKSNTPEEVKVIAQKIKFIDNEFFTKAVQD